MHKSGIKKLLELELSLLVLKNYLKYNNKLNEINDFQGYIHNFKLRLFIAF